MLLAMVSDVRVVLIKLADRLHNMRTLEHLKPDRQEAIARETQDIYAPLAHRLGMGKVRGELEDLAFRYTDPVSFEKVSEAVEARRIEGEQFLRGVEDTLIEQLRENGIEARVPRSLSTRSTTFSPSASSPRTWLPVTRFSGSSTPCGDRCRGASRTLSPCLAPTTTSRSTPR